MVWRIVWEMEMVAVIAQENSLGNGSEIASGNDLGNCLGNGLGSDLNGVGPMQQIDHTHQMQQLDLNCGGNSVLSAKRCPMW